MLSRLVRFLLLAVVLMLAPIAIVDVFVVGSSCAIVHMWSAGQVGDPLVRVKLSSRALFCVGLRPGCGGQCMVNISLGELLPSRGGGRPGTPFYAWLVSACRGVPWRVRGCFG